MTLTLQLVLWLIAAACFALAALKFDRVALDWTAAGFCFTVLGLVVA